MCDQRIHAAVSPDTPQIETFILCDLSSKKSELVCDVRNHHVGISSCKRNICQIKYHFLLLQPFFVILIIKHFTLADHIKKRLSTFQKSTYSVFQDIRIRLPPSGFSSTSNDALSPNIICILDFTLYIPICSFPYSSITL